MVLIDSSEIFQGKILIVDDRQANILLLEQMLRGAGYDSIESTTDPNQVSELHRNNQYDLILLDMQMPGTDGFQVLERLKEVETEGYLPVLVITVNPDLKLRALQAGAKDFISKPFDLAEVLIRVRNMIEVRLLHIELHKYNTVLEKRVRERTLDLQESYLQTIYTVTRAAEYRDKDTGAHVQRISYFSRELARALGMGEEYSDTIFFTSPMHDIGKIGIPDRILLKPGALTPEEWGIMKAHTTIGATMIGDSKSRYLQMGAEIALNHHEHWDGGGYPNGKRGEEIPLSARIMILCDNYDALRSKRPYKPAFDHQKTMDIMTHGDGRTTPDYFDPALLSLFNKHHQSFRGIFEEHQV